PVGPLWRVSNNHAGIARVGGERPKPWGAREVPPPASRCVSFLTLSSPVPPAASVLSLGSAHARRRLRGQAVAERVGREGTIEHGGHHTHQQPAQRRRQPRAPAIAGPSPSSPHSRRNTAAKQSSKTPPKRFSRSLLSIQPWP